MHAVLFTTSIEDVCDLYQFTYDYLLLVIIYLLFLFFFIHYFFECNQINETSLELQAETILMSRTFAVLLCYLRGSERKA